MTSPDEPHTVDTPLRILVTGASGLIGSSLIPVLEKQGHEVLRAVRRPPETAAEVCWRPMMNAEDVPTEELEAFEDLDVVIHLAGENIAAGRWSAKRKSRIRSSRVEATRNLVALLKRTSSPPTTFISSSAVGGYPGDGDDEMTETSPLGDSFLSQLCRDWEQSSVPLETIGIRLVHLRIGLVLTPAGGILGKLLPLFRCCLGSRLGSGRQWISWIDLQDLIRIVLLAIEDPKIDGALNCVAPGAVRNIDFTNTLAAALNRPVAPPIPGFIIRMLWGEMGQALLLEGPRVTPARLDAIGFRFLSPDLPSALRNQLR
ncbi:MAG: TIGR01777 family oxidoreductase [Planctomycetota bacterium]|nr:TIGR01777 family oxidoreductase [Planctomycetota bacterium]